jgi:hypothetical protein
MRPEEARIRHPPSAYATNQVGLEVGTPAAKPLGAAVAMLPRGLADPQVKVGLTLAE